MKIRFLICAMLMFAVGCASHGPITATSNKVGKARGLACRSNLLFIIPLSIDASIHSAAMNGRITKISTVDYSSFYSIIFNSRCTIVHGFREKPKNTSEVKLEKEPILEKKE